MVQSHHRQRALFHHLTSVGRSFCKIKKEKKTQSEVKWANMLLLSAQACTENQPAWPCPCQAKHLYSPEKSETIDKHRSKPEVAPLAIMFPAVRVCALIDSASSSAERDPEGSSLAACFVSCGRPLSARAGTLRTAGGPAQALPLTGGCSWCAPRPLHHGRAPRPQTHLTAIISASPQKGGKAKGKGEGNSKAFKIWNCS